MSFVAVTDCAAEADVLLTVVRQPSPMAVLERELLQLAELIDRLSDQQFRLCPVGVFASSVGAHVRHCLEHVEAFLNGVGTGLINYDSRKRDREIETNRAAATRRISALATQANELAESRLDRPVRLTIMISKTGPTLNVRSSVGRELAFVLSHTTHHNAIVAAMASTMNVATSPEFGVAPATAIYREQEPCVR